MTDQSEELARWVAERPDHAIQLRELLGKLEDRTSWRIRLLIHDAAPLPPQATWDDIARTLDSGARVDVAMAQHGGRYVVGHLLTRRTVAQLMLEGLTERGTELGAIWVYPKPHRAHFTWAEQLNITIDAEKPPAPSLIPSAANTRNEVDWHVRPGEDLLVHSYWKQHGAGGSLAVEVPMPDDGTRKIDGVIVGDGRDVVVGRTVHWDGIDSDTPVTVIEAKQVPRAGTKGAATDIEMVIGQAAAGRAGIAWRLDRPPETVRAVALTGPGAPPSLLQIGERLGIDIVEVEQSRLFQVALAPGDPALDRVARLAERDACSPADAIRRLIGAADV